MPASSIFKIRPDLPYMTLPEMQLFKQLRESSDVSFYREGKCKRCETMIYIDKSYCSKRCFDQHATEEEKTALAAKLGKPKRVQREAPDDDDW